MVLEKNFPAILPTKEVIFTVPVPNAQAVPWQNEIIRVAGVAADATIPKARRKAAANLLTYWKTMHKFIMERLDRADINLNHYWTTMPQDTKDILGYIAHAPPLSSSSKNFVPSARGILETPRPIHRRSQTRSDPQRRNRRSNARRTRSANARVVYRRVSEMDPRSTHSNADPLDPGHRFPPRVPTYKRGPLDPI